MSLGPAFTGPRVKTAWHEKIVSKIKSIVMRTTNNIFRKVHNYIHFIRSFTQFEGKCNVLEIFHYLQYFERFRSMKKWQISKGVLMGLTDRRKTAKNLVDSRKN